MLPRSLSRAIAKPSGLVLSAALALLLSACGGGGGSPGTVPGGSNSTVGLEPKASIAVLNAGGTAVTSVSGTQSVNVKVTLLDARGVPAPAEIVTFTSSSALVEFTSSALTDTAGVATISVKPISVNSAGAVAITATAVVAGKTATATANLAVVAASLTVGPLGFSPNPPPTRLQAGSALLLNIPVTTGGQPASGAPGLVLTSLCMSDGSATIVPGTFSGGVQSATYTNNGCLRGTDVITAQLGASVQTIQVGVDVANLGSIQFVSSDLVGASIVLRGSGGLGRQEAALLTFRVLDQNNQPLSGVVVDFTPSTSTGGLSVAPARSTSDATGRVTTTVSSGTIPTPVRVFAQASRNGTTISGLSDTLTISTGLPIAKGVSLSATSYNIEGWDIDGALADITIRLADQFGNPISNDTAVSFVSEGGAIGSSARGACVTTSGACSVKLSSQNFRPLNGRVTIMAFVQGLENFVDANGDGQYSCTNFVAPDGSKPAVYRPLIDTCVSGGESFTDQGDPFLDAGIIGSLFGLNDRGIYGGLDGTYTAANGDFPIPFRGSTYSAAGDGKWGLNFLSTSAEIVFSGSTGYLRRQVCTDTGCVDSTAASADQKEVVTSCKETLVGVRLHDVNNNPMPPKTTISIVDLNKVTSSAVAPAAVAPTSDIGGTLHTFSIKPDASCSAGSFGIKVTTPGAGGVGATDTFHTFTTK